MGSTPGRGQGGVLGAVPIEGRCPGVFFGFFGRRVFCDRYPTGPGFCPSWLVLAPVLSWPGAVWACLWLVVAFCWLWLLWPFGLLPLFLPFWSPWPSCLGLAWAFVFCCLRLFRLFALLFRAVWAAVALWWGFLSLRQHWGVGCLLFLWRCSLGFGWWWRQW